MGPDKPQRSEPMSDVIFLGAGIGLISVVILYAIALMRA